MIIALLTAIFVLLVAVVFILLDMKTEIEKIVEEQPVKKREPKW